MRNIDADALREELKSAMLTNSRAGHDTVTLVLAKMIEVLDLTPTVETPMAVLDTTASGWISVNDELPKNEKPVLVAAIRKLYDGRTTRKVVCGFYEDGSLKSGNSRYEWEESAAYDHMTYDEESDEFFVPEGWWECVNYSDTFCAIDDFVTHWMPLPEPPEVK